MIVLLDATTSSLTVSWPPIPKAKGYTLEYRLGNSRSFLLLSNKLTSSQARKRNLTDDEKKGFTFRVQGILSSDNGGSNEATPWVTHDHPFHLLTEQEVKHQIVKHPPKAVPNGSHAAIVSWDEVPPSSSSSNTTYKYELQMRENEGGIAWTTIAPSLLGTQVRKKNLVSKLGYQFRVRPSSSSAATTSTVNHPFSPPSDPQVFPGLAPGIRTIFSSLQHGKLMKSVHTYVSLQDALASKEFVLLYASAHWCPPCRRYTPQLEQFYIQTARNAPNAIEIVFLSADHDVNGFHSYYSASMPWLAVPYEEEAREDIMGKFRVKGIPRLVVLDGRSGRTLVENAVEGVLDLNRWRTLAGTI